ncbi:MAG: hypothetical protein VR73_01715 [Gammaproteobacteria bacterium BRH_c0]|nr:MAG: hypothetical protein VR73_01715 [Gammaproteobacteria bacterium BRH_c0]
MTIPKDYSYQESPSAFVNHVGKIYHKRSTAADGGEEVWTALEIQDHHVNTWGFCHGAVMSSLAEMGTAAPAWDPDGPPVVAIEMNMQFIRAPKLGQLLEVCGTVSQRTRSLVFCQARAYADGELVFTASSIQKILKA